MSRTEINAEPIVQTGVEYERREVNYRVLFWLGVGFVLAGVVLHLTLWGMYDYFAARDRRNNLQPSTTIRTAQREYPPVPHLQTAPEVDLERYQQAQHEELESYEWVDRNAGVVKIPIERAMELTVQRGLPVMSGDKTPPSARRGETPGRSGSGKASEKSPLNQR